MLTIKVYTFSRIYQKINEIETKQDTFGQEKFL